MKPAQWLHKAINKFIITILFFSLFKNRVWFWVKCLRRGLKNRSTVLNRGRLSVPAVPPYPPERLSSYTMDHGSYIWWTAYIPGTTRTKCVNFSGFISSNSNVLIFHKSPLEVLLKSYHRNISSLPFGDCAACNYWITWTVVMMS